MYRNLNQPVLLLLGEECDGIEGHGRRRAQLAGRRRQMVLQLIDVELLEVAGEHGELLIEESGD